MANTKTINVQYKLRGDTLAKLSAKNAVYGVNEPVVVVVPADSNTGLNEPAVLLKIGDGKTTFNNLEYVSARAADVAAWAKDATKPVYTAAEIQGLAEYIGDVTDTDTQYKLEQDTTDNHILRLMSKAKNAESWETVVAITTADTVYDDTEIKNTVAQITTSVEGKADKAATLAGYGITDAMTAIEVQAAIQTAVASGTRPSFKRVDQIPEASAAQDGILYLVPKDSGSGYDIYAKIEDTVTNLGDTSVNLSDVIKTVKVGGTALSTVNGEVDIPGATALALGLVKGTDAENGVNVKNDFTMEVNSLNVNKLVQTDGDTLILDGGSVEI